MIDLVRQGERHSIVSYTSVVCNACVRTKLWTQFLYCEQGSCRMWVNFHHHHYRRSIDL